VPKSDEWISERISELMHHGKEQDQAVAIAFSEAGRSRKGGGNPGPRAAPPATMSRGVTPPVAKSAGGTRRPPPRMRR